MSASLAIAPAYSQGLVAVNDNQEPTGGLAILLGEVRGELRGMREDMAEVKAALADASTSRTQLTEKVGLLDKRLEKVEGSVTVMGGVVAKQAGRIDRIEPLALWMIAAGAGLLVVGGALWYALLNYGADLVRWLSQIIPRQ